MLTEIVSINGEIFEPAKARISVFDRGFLYGDSVYEAARSYDGVFFAMEDHVERLFNSARMIGLKIGRSEEEIIEEIYRVYRTINVQSAAMRIVVTRGEGPINLDPQIATKPNILIFIRPLEQVDTSLYEEGMNVITAAVFRNPKKSLDPNIKSGNYLNNVMALGEAKVRRAHDALMVNREGFVTEGTTWNIYMVKNNEIISPPDDADILRGITRKTLKKITAGGSISWVERYFSVDELKKADEVFASGSVKEVMPIRSVDEILIGTGRKGPVTTLIMGQYKKYVAQYCANARRRLDG